MTFAVGVSWEANRPANVSCAIADPGGHAHPLGRKSCFFMPAMSNWQRNHSAIEEGATQFEMISGLQHALDLSYQRLIRAAKGEWERRFAGNDPSDACISVRIETDARPVRGSAFLARPDSSRPAKGRKYPFPRLAR